LYFGQSYFSRFISILIGVLLSTLVLINEIFRRNQKIKHGTLAEKQWVMIVRWLVITVGIGIMVFVMDRYRGMPVPVLIMFVVALALNMVAAHTTFGRSIYAIGGNLDTAKYAGITDPANIYLDINGISYRRIKKISFNPFRYSTQHVHMFFRRFPQTFSHPLRCLGTYPVFHIRINMLFGI
jgi:hypothetical protein